MPEKPEAATLDWATVGHEFAFDGAWRDIYVVGTTASDGTRLLRALSLSNYPLSYTRAGVQVELPEEAAAAFPSAGECDRLLSIDVAGVQMIAHFFAESEIEFDMDPREITAQARLDAALDFMRFLSRCLNKDVILTPENSRGEVNLSRPTERRPGGVSARAPVNDVRDD